MTLKHVLKLFSKTEVQEDEKLVIQKTKYEESQNQEVLRSAQDDEALYPLPLRERKELLSEQSELSNSGEGYISCAKHTVKNLLSNRLNVLTTLKKAAFTLAEVLITLGIIGVVAALTLPTLIANHQKQAYVTGLKKAYANIQNAFAKMAYDEDVTEWSQTYCFSDSYNTMLSEECFNRFKKQFNAVKSEIFEHFDDGASAFGIDVKGYFYTNDGMVYIVSCSGIDGISVDVNGDKGPNKWGRDRFSFYIEPTKNKVVPSGINNYQTYCTTEYINSGNIGHTCTAKVLIEGKMDY